MKTGSIIGAFILSSILTFSVLAQSTFRFENFNPFTGVDAPVFDAQGVRLAGASYGVELWGGPASNSLSPTLTYFGLQRVILPFGTGMAAGYFTTTSSMTVWSVPPGDFAWVQVRAWDTRLGATYEEVAALGYGGYGESSLLYLHGGNPTGLPTAPNPLTGLQSFSLLPVIPEPSTWALLALGVVRIWFTVRRKH